MERAIWVAPGIPHGQVDIAVDIFCAALHQKLSPFLGSPERATAFLAPTVVPERAFTALVDGKVVGIAGFKHDGCGLFRPRWADFRQAFGWSALFRLAGLALLERPEEPDCLLMDGIAVADSARGRGVGTCLLAAIERHAAALGKRSVRLDVIDTNVAARRLYERFGFAAQQSRGVGPFRLIFDFRETTEMRKTATPPPAVSSPG